MALAVDGVRVGDRIFVITWLHLPQRDTLVTRPRIVEDAPSRVRNPLAGSAQPHRDPRPHVTRIDGTRIYVDGLDAIDGTPILDVKPLLGPIAER